ncbi:MAG: hypothetical protein ACFB0D_03640 [Phormidesmis sp.]
MVNPTIAEQKPSRIKIPFLLDIVTVSDPEQIRQIETSGDVDRLHAYPTKELPWWVQFYFRSTKFHDHIATFGFAPLSPPSSPLTQQEEPI